MTINVFTAPRCRLTFNGIVVALAKSVSVQEETQYEPIEVLDSLEVLEHEPVRYTCSMSAAEVLVVGKTMEALGFAARKGTNANEHLRNLLALKDLTAQLEDSAGTTVVARVYGCKVASKGMSVSPGSSVARDVNFVARRMIEAAEVL